MRKFKTWVAVEWRLMKENPEMLIVQPILIGFFVYCFLESIKCKG